MHGGTTRRLSRRLLSRPALTVAVGKAVLLIGRDLSLLRRGEIDAREFRGRTGGHLGSSAGIVAGAAAGIAFGAIMPGIGTLLGAFSGGLFGAMAGEHVGRATADLLEEHLGPPEDDG